MDHITVKGLQFEIPSRYVEGHECSAGEAKTLQQKYAKVLDVWLRKKLKNGGDPEEVQSELDGYASKYQLGQRVATGPRPKDPIAIQAFKDALRDVRLKFKQAGGKLKDLRQGLANQKARAWVADASRGYMVNAAKKLKKGGAEVPQVDPDILDLL